jgi:hypothetical protein
MKRLFNKKAYDEVDNSSKLAAIRLMKTRRYELISDLNTEYYKDFDCVFQHLLTKKILKIENEYRMSFNRIKNEFKTIHIPLRKSASKADYYFVWGNNYNEVAIIEMPKALKFSNNPVSVYCQSELSESKEPYIEEFIDVPKDLFQFFIKKNNWKKNNK